MSSKGSTAVGLIVAVLIVAAIASIGYYQFEVAPYQTGSATTTSMENVVCAKTNCGYVNITSGAGSCIDSTKPCGFSPLTITVVMGVNNTVFWSSQDSSVHTVTGSNWGSAANPGLMQGDTYQYTFSAAGTYSYHCIYHAGMVATVIVKSA